MLFTARGLAKFYGMDTILAGIDLEIAEKDQLAITGPSGVGKSTLLGCLAGIMTPSRGQVLYRGQDLNAMSFAKKSRLRAEHFGIVFQTGQLIPDLKVLENVALPLLIMGFSRRQSRRRADEVLESLRLEPLANRLAATLTPGQWQQVAIARATANRPKVILADEPTAALDQVRAHEMMQYLTSYAQINQASLIVVTHDLEIASWCQRQVELRDGLIASDRQTGGAGRSDHCDLKGVQASRPVATAQTQILSDTGAEDDPNLL